MKDYIIHELKIDWLDDVIFDLLCTKEETKEKAEKLLVVANYLCENCFANVHIANIKEEVADLLEQHFALVEVREYMEKTLPQEKIIKEEERIAPVTIKNLVENGVEIACKEFIERIAPFAYESSFDNASEFIGFFKGGLYYEEPEYIRNDIFISLMNAIEGSEFAELTIQEIWKKFFNVSEPQNFESYFSKKTDKATKIYY